MLTVWQDRYRLWHVARGTTRKLQAGYPSKWGRVELFISAAGARQWASNRFPGEPIDRDDRLFKPRSVSKLPFIQVSDTEARAGLKEFEHETKDCTVRALAASTGSAYSDAHAACKSAGRVDKYGFCPGELLGYLTDRSVKVLGHRFTKMFMFRSPPGGKKYSSIRFGDVRVSLADFVRANPEGTYYVCNRSHAYVVYDGTVCDYVARTGREKLTDAWKVEKL